MDKSKTALDIPPNDDDELPNAGVDDAPKAGIVFPKAGDDDAPKVAVEEKGEEDWAAPNTPVEVPPNKEPPVCEPKGVELPKGFGAKGLLLALFVCPKTDGDPNGLLDDCPKAAIWIHLLICISKRSPIKKRTELQNSEDVQMKKKIQMTK